MKNKSASWNLLNDYATRDTDRNIKGLFDADTERFSKYSLQVGSMLFDYSKTWSQTTCVMLCLI